MSRPLRIEYPDGWYHVMNRGRRAELIFSDRQDYLMFTELMRETSEMWKIKISSYCLMPNHYHMLIQTPEANISRSMRHLNGVYTQRYNRRHHCDGQLFRGRFKSILVSGDSYLLQAVRYIHRNPLRAGLVEVIDVYPWSSHKGYISVARNWEWLHKKYILSLLSKSRKDWLRYYKEWVSVEDEDEVRKKLDGKKWPSILGPEEFIDRFKGKYCTPEIAEEVPGARELLPGVDQILEAVGRFYGVGVFALKEKRRGRANEARNAAIYLTRRLRRDTLKEIGEQFQIDRYSTVSSTIERMKKRMLEDRALSRRMEELAVSIGKSQEQT